MKLCDIAILYSPHGGGIKTYIDNKRIVYKKRGIEHILIAPNVEKPGSQELVTDGSLKLYYIPCRKISLFGTSYFIFRSFADVKRILVDEKPDIIEVGDKITTLLFKSAIRKIHSYLKVKIFAFSHERADNFSKTVIGNKWLGSLVGQIFIKRFISSADAVIANSDFTGEEILKYLPKEKLHVTALGINIDAFDEDRYFDEAMYNELNENGKKTLLIHVGRLDKDKKTDLLLDVANELDERKYKLIIVGGGSYEKYFKELPIVFLTGYIPYGEVKKYLTVADAGVLVNDIEPFGLVGLEMMAAKMTIFGPNKGGLSSFLKKDFAYLLPYDKDAYIQAIENWNALPKADKDQMAEAAKAEVENYSLAMMVDHILEIYRANV